MTRTTHPRTGPATRGIALRGPCALGLLLVLLALLRCTAIPGPLPTPSGAPDGGRGADQAVVFPDAAVPFVDWRVQGQDNGPWANLGDGSTRDHDSRVDGSADAAGEARISDLQAVDGSAPGGDARTDGGSPDSSGTDSSNGDVLTTDSTENDQ